MSSPAASEYLRPQYEKGGDRAEEARVATILCNLWNCNLVKLPTAYSLDYAATRDKQVLSWVEIKRRQRTLRKYRCVFLSMQKVFSAYNFNIVTGLPCLFVIQFDDCLAYANILEPSRPIEFRGRTDRGDWQDQEPVIAIGADDFKLCVA